MKVLVVDPDSESRDSLRRAVSAAGGQVRSVGSATEARRHLSEFLPDVVVYAVDLPAEEIEGLSADARRDQSDRVLWALAPAGRLEDAVSAMENGADDFLWRPVSAGRVAFLLDTVRRRREERERTEEARLRLARVEAAVALPGRSGRWLEAMASIEQLAPERAVLVTGEDGTEKEIAARFLHRLSERGAEHFARAVDGEGFVEALERAGTGTLFVTGIDRVSAGVQEKILAALEAETGPGLVLTADRDPVEAVRRGELARAIVHRLQESVLHLPPLRERGDDVARLARQFLEEASDTASFDPEAMDALTAHDWPGNVTELREAVRRAARLAEGPTIGPTVVRSVLGRPLAARGSRRRKVPVVRIAVGDSLADVERRLIQKTLEFARGNKRKTAELLKLSLKTIYNKIKEYGLEH